MGRASVKPHHEPFRGLSQKEYDDSRRTQGAPPSDAAPVAPSPAATPPADTPRLRPPERQLSMGSCESTAALYHRAGACASHTGDGHVRWP
eukprot:7355231-Prymnesium_polylepis.1